MAPEQEFMTGILSKDTRFRLVLSANIVTPELLEQLIEFLKIQKTFLEENPDVNSPTQTDKTS